MQPTRANQISDLVNFQMPEFVRVDHPTLIAFLEAYYEWLQLTDREGKILSPLILPDVVDIDETMDQFLAQFKKQYLFNFPEELAISKDSGKPVDVRKLAKHIKAFYKAKGTEKSYEFLFRILYDVGVEFYYPKKDILRVSDGKWNEKISLKVTNALGDRIFESLGRIVYQKNSLGEIISSAKVIDISVYQEGIYDVAELTLTAKNGTFQVGTLGVLFDTDTETLKEIRVYSVVSSVTVSNGGSGYAVGDEVSFISAGGDVGKGAKGSVSLVSSTGAIRKIRMESFGINYQSAPTISISSIAGSGFSGTANVGTLCQSEGYYLNNDGRLSTNKVLQDNHYYQEYSYVLKTEVVVDKYREVVRRLIHPAGTAMFGQVQIKRCSKSNIHNSSAMIRYEVPLIGHYAPYTFQTFDNLQDWFQITDEFGGLTASGYSPTSHDTKIRGFGNGSALQGNPISNGITFKYAKKIITYNAVPPFGLPTYSLPIDALPVTEVTVEEVSMGGVLGLKGTENADPFWIVYEHPNRKILAPVIAQVWRDQLTDFLDWPERCSVTGGNASSTWADDFDDDPTLEKKYAFLQYDTSSEFRKITARAFFEMPIGDSFDCRIDSDTVISRPSLRITTPTASSSYPKATTGNLSISVTIDNFANNQIIPIQERISDVRVYVDGSDYSNRLVGGPQITLTPSFTALLNVTTNLSVGIHRIDIVPLGVSGRRCTMISAATVEIIVT